MKITIEFDDISQLEDLSNWFREFFDKMGVRHSQEYRIVLDKDKLRFPKGTCQKCGGVLAKGAISYCRQHETARVREWRKSKKEKK